MLNQKELNTLEKGDQVDHFLLLKKCEIRLTKAGKQYLFLELGDKSLSLNANVWDSFENFYEMAKTGDVVKVAGSMDDYQGAPQIRINSIRILKASEKVSPIDFLPKSKRDPDVMRKEFRDRIDRIANRYLKELMNLVFTEDNFAKFSAAPAGKSWHHSYVHGLIEHTLEIIRICDLMCDIHQEINRDLLISGAMMHDFGKTEELSFDSSFDYTDKGKLLGHIVISSMIINEETKKIEGFPEDLKNCLIHIILSHQGKLEYASPVVPKTLEAITLYQADELSAKVNAYKNAIASGAGTDAKWTRYITLASTDLYNHGIRGEDEEGEQKSLFD
jgi:3'-5' exoribonuclease